VKTNVKEVANPQGGATARRSDRISLEIPIQVSGSDGEARSFVDDTHTVLVSRHGAKILRWRKLVPEQEITVGCPGTGKEATAKVVGQLGEEGGKYAYGIAFLDAEVNPWDIEFPPLAESEQAVGRALLECLSCHAREITYLDDMEAESLETNGRLSRACKRCGTCLWKVSSDQVSAPERPPTEPMAPSVPEAHSAKTHLGLRLKACLRHPQFGDEVVATETVSRAGFTFKSAKNYEATMPLQVAVPFLPGGANIFAPIQIERAEFLPAERVTRYAVSYIPIHKGWSAK
jgi:hypothetical protein